MKTKKLKITDIILFTFSAIFVLDSFAAAKIGGLSIIYGFLLAIFYFLPYGFISAELSSTFGDEGGVYYVWVKKSFGGRGAARTNGLYGINVGLGMPSVYLAFSSTL